jgi:hypothetical protein
MRTTLDIDQDILLTAKELAAQEGPSAGKVLSNLARQGLFRNRNAKTRNGIPLFPRKANAKSVTLEFVNRLRDQLP